VSLQNATVHGVEYKPISYDSLFPLPVNGSLPLYATSLDPAAATDACSALPASTPDLSGHVVLIRRGGCAFTTKLDNAAAKGGKYFLIYNNVAGLETITVGNYIAALILPEDGTFVSLVWLLFPDEKHSIEYLVGEPTCRGQEPYCRVSSKGCLLPVSAPR
jgi:hypothetical protein